MKRGKSLALPLNRDNSLYDVRAMVDNPRYSVGTHTRVPIGKVARNQDGTWSRTSWPSTHLGPVFGTYRTPALAAAGLYRTYRAYVGW